MANTKGLLCAVSMMFISMLLCIDATCQLDAATVWGTNYKILHCTDMMENQFFDDAKQFIKSDFHILKLDNVNTTKLPDYANWFTNVNRIEIARNKMFMGVDFNQNFTQLYYLNVSDSNNNFIFNGVSYISKRSIYLYFSNNKINKITSLCRGNYDFPWALHLNYNNIQSFNTADVGVSECKNKLLWLNLDHNHITLLNAEVFISLPGLKYIYLSHNKIATIQNDLCNKSLVINVMTLSLSHNKLTNLNADCFRFFFLIRNFKFII